MKAEKINWRVEYRDLMREWQRLNRVNQRLLKEKQKILKELHDMASGGDLRNIRTKTLKQFNRAVRLCNR